MATFPLAFPAVPVATERLTLAHRQSASESPFNYAVQVVNAASRWELEWTWPRMSWPKAQALRAWLDGLRGQVGTFRYYPRGLTGGTTPALTLATKAFAYNGAVQVTGYAANAASKLIVGQYLSLGDQLFRITDAGANADGAGHVTVSVEPQLRVDVAAGTVVNLTTPSGLFRLVALDGLGFTLDPDRTPDFGTIQAREAIG